MKLLTVKEISERMVRRLCTEGRIPEAILENNSWMIPAGTKKPDRKPRAKGVKKE